MKKILWIVVLVVLALGALGIGIVVAQGGQPPVYDNMTGMMWGGRGGYGPMHAYMEQALAGKLGLTDAQVEDALASGKTMYQLAIDNGVAEADLSAFMTEVHQSAFDRAVADGVLTQDQAKWMLERMQGTDADGYGLGNCTMGGVRPQDGSGFRNGMGPGYRNGSGQGMMGSGRWRQVPAPGGN
jgi:hypothetical protein